AAGSFPLVVISHGYPGNRYLMCHLGENLASKGFVTVAIDHTDSTYDDQQAFASTLYNRPLDQRFVIERIAEAYELEGGDAWFNSPPSRFLGNDYDPDDFEQGRDVVEVWFDSGATHSFVLEKRPELKWPADLYLEGSDQHRGWFHSSLLVGVGTRGRAPYDAILTHGFV
ncbi:MAG: class I tRNA ligase family protein, partial [Pseudomonadota bacterium]|nr:class I tRNA ligase family protein [Pseudomonadota bacterium]